MSVLHIHKSFPGVFAAFFFVAVAAACGDDDDDNGGTGPQAIGRPDIIGGYVATTFRTTIGGATTDQLAVGAEFTIDVAADGTATGRLFVPDGAEDGGDLHADLEGSWTFNDSSDEVEFEQTADTFVRDVTFEAVRAGATIELRGDETFGIIRIVVVLTRE